MQAAIAVSAPCHRGARSCAVCPVGTFWEHAGRIWPRSDPNKLETALLRDRFDRHGIYLSLAAEVEEVANVFSNTALAMRALVKPVSLAGYEIAKPISKRSDAIRGKIAKALDFYSGRALAAAATRRANNGKEPKTIGG